LASWPVCPFCQSVRMRDAFFAARSSSRRSARRRARSSAWWPSCGRRCDSFAAAAGTQRRWRPAVCPSPRPSALECVPAARHHRRALAPRRPDAEAAAVGPRLLFHGRRRGGSRLEQPKGGRAHVRAPRGRREHHRLAVLRPRRIPCSTATAPCPFRQSDWCCSRTTTSSTLSRLYQSSPRWRRSSVRRTPARLDTDKGPRRDVPTV